MLDRIHRVLRKPPGVVAYRAWQEGQLAWMRGFGAWRRVEKAAADWAASTSVAPQRLVAPDARLAYERAAAIGSLDLAALREYGLRSARRDFAIFGARVPQSGSLPWNEDWRFGKRWPQAYFGDFDFYESRQESYDVKYPWELSRLAFLLPIAQSALLARDRSAALAIVSIIDEWCAHNPTAYSINWYPMEASMRTIALVLVSEMLSVSGMATQAELRRLAALIAVHGEFVARTLEYTDICGNHFAANIVAMLLAGIASPGFAGAAKWKADAARAIEREIGSQILADGVDFEKSTSYHRLVTELFVVAAVAMRRAGMAISSAAHERLRRAVIYTNAYTRPDGWAPNIGDNDDGRVLQLDGVPARDHRPIVSLGGAFFQESLAKTTSFLSAAIPLLLGCEGVHAWEQVPVTEPPQLVAYQEGGYIVARHDGHFFMIDVGEVGLAGRGGHGHNDLLSFELAIGGTPLVIDPGSYLYTGDLESRRWFQSTAAHNGLELDGVEIAEIRGPWRIDDAAHPLDVAVERAGDAITVRASHDGYWRLSFPAMHRREARFERHTGRLRVTDTIESSGAHVARRFLHFPPAASVQIDADHATVTIGDRNMRISWDAANAGVTQRWISDSYGVREQAPVLVLENATDGNWTSSFEIAAG